MTIPYNTAGQHAFDVFYRVAARLYAAGREARTARTAGQLGNAMQTADTSGQYARQTDRAAR